MDPTSHPTTHPSPPSPPRRAFLHWVTGGLSAGQRVITLGGSLVRDGQEVRVLP